MNPHYHQLSLKPLSLDSKVKGFSLYVESEDSRSAIIALENFLSQLNGENTAFKESGKMVGNIRASYSYPVILAVQRKNFSGMTRINQTFLGRLPCDKTQVPSL